MAETTTLVALQDLDRILLAALEGRRDDVDLLEDDALLAVFEAELGKVWARPPRSSESRNAVNSGLSRLDYARSVMRRSNALSQGKLRSTGSNFLSTTSSNRPC